MMQGPGSPIALLRQLLGGDVVTTEPQELAPFEKDHRALFRGRALALARPRHTADVAKILGFCNAQRIGVVPVGGNTGYCGGATP
ncbi:MAG: FAD-binding protein, partial [Steroidobacteraceae bacterium]|nr:FAD-binding protein [Steroidobacteraceae bacterium]MDW8260007.1 FAD-binding protein [Gammaproteobacteria bacterium]